MNKPKRPGQDKPGRVYAVRDPMGLAAIVRAALDARFGGAQNRAREVVSQPTLSRCLRGEATALRQPTFDRLRRLVGPEQTEALFDVVVGPEASTALVAYARWIVERANRFPGRRGHRWVWRRGLARYRKTRRAFTARLEELDGVLEALQQHDTLSSHFGSFKAWCAERGHESAAYQFACVRVVEPLLESPESGFVERGWLELEAEEMAQFLEAGFKRERILLNRAPQLQRSQEVARDAPLSRASPLGRALRAHLRRRHTAQQAELDELTRDD